MSSKTQKNPSIRFKGFTDAWEQRKLVEELSLLKDGTHGTHIDTENGPYLLSAKNIKNGRVNITPADRKISIEEFNKIHTNFSLQAGDVLLTIVGSIGETAVLNNADNITFQRSVAYLRPKSMNSQFLYTTISGPLFQKELKNRQVVSAQPGIYLGDLAKIDITIPDIVEQTAIASFFKQLDDTIALHQRQQDNYKQLKKYMLQKIFNQEFRFKDKNGNDYPDWEEIALKELGETFTGLSGKTKENFGKGKGKFVTYMNVFSNSTANLAMTENVEIKDGEKQNEVRYGDIFFTTSSETPDEVGMSSVWLSHESNVYLNSFCFGYRLNSESEGKVTHQFLGVQLRADRIRKQIVFLAQGSTRFNISKAKLTEIPVYLPAIQEQQKIADFLSMLDLRIEQLSQKVELLKEQKKGLIQQMFV